MGDGMICPTSGKPVWQGVASGAETWPEMLPHHHLPPLGGGGCGKACSASRSVAILGEATGGLKWVS